MSLRRRMQVLVAAAVVPLSALLVFDAYGNWRHLQEEAQRTALDQARLLAGTIDAMLEGARQVAGAVASRFAEGPIDAATCSTYLNAIVRSEPRYFGIAVLTPEGRVRCSANPAPPDLSVADRAYFRAALGARGLVVGEVVEGRVVGQKSLPLAMAFRAADGQVAGIVVLPLNLEELAKSLAGQFPADRGFALVIDRAGAVAARVPDHAAMVGRRTPLPDGGRRGPHVVEHADHLGRPHIVGVIPIDGERRGLALLAGLDREKALAPAREAILRSAVVGAGLIAVAMLAVWLAGRRLIERPVRAFLDTAQRRAAGDLAARFPQGRPETEFGRLGAALNDMAGEIDRLVAQKTHLIDELEDREQRFRALFDQSSAGIARCDARGRILLATPHLCRLLGYAEDELIGRRIVEFAHPDDRDQSIRLFRRMIETGQGFRLERRLLHKDGRVVWVDASVSPVRDAAGAVEDAAVVVVDVSERKRAEIQLKESSEILRLINEGTSTLLYAKDREGRLTMVNPATLRVFGKTADEVIGRRAPENFRDAEAARQIAENDRRVMEGGAPMTFEETAQLPDGPHVFLSAKAPLRDASGAVVGIIGASMDITERKEAEERARLLLRELDHRAKNMLAVMQAIVQLSRGETSAEIKQAIIGRIHALSSAHSLISSTGWKGADLRRLVELGLAPFRQAAPERVRVGGPTLILPPAVGQALSIVLYELATNALKYGALSDPNGRVSLEWSREIGAPLRLRWEESGGPPARPPERQGFGSTVINGLIASQLSGSVEFFWRPEGLLVDIAVPLEIAAKPG